MAMRVGDYDALIAKRNETGRLVAEAFMIVHLPQWHLVGRLIAQGAIGRLAHVEGRFTFDNCTDVDNTRNKS